MARPTIPDLAMAAGVSVSTVNRVLAQTARVHPDTRAQVQAAAEMIGFYATGAIQSRVAASRPRLRLGVLLLQPHRPFYQNVARALETAAAAISDAEVTLNITFLQDLSPQATADAIRVLGDQAQAICVTTAIHPLVIQAIDEVQSRGIPVFALIAPLTARR